MQSVNVFVASPNPQRFLHVTVLITVDDGAKLLQNQLSHVPQLNRNFIRKLLVSDLLRALGNVAAKITDALKIGCNRESPDNLTQIDRERLTLCNCLDRLGFDCSL